MISRSENNSAVHRVLAMKLFISDPVSAALIVRKTERSDLHRFWEREYSGISPGTPTSLAMYQPKLFVRWVRVLREVGVDLREFVKEDLDSRVLKEEGWRVDTLRRLLSWWVVKLWSRRLLRVLFCGVRDVEGRRGFCG